MRAGEREALERFDVEIVDSAPDPIESSASAVRIRADALALLMSDRPKTKSRWGAWYPDLAYVIAHEMGHWAVPAEPDDTPARVERSSMPRR